MGVFWDLSMVYQWFALDPTFFPSKYKLNYFFAAFHSLQTFFRAAQHPHTHLSAIITMYTQNGQKQSHATYMSEPGGPPPGHQPAINQQAASVPTQQHGGAQVVYGHNYFDLNPHLQPQQAQHPQIQHPQAQHPQVQYLQLEHQQLQYPYIQHHQLQHQQLQQRQLQQQQFQYQQELQRQQSQYQQLPHAGNSMPHMGATHGDYPPHPIVANMQNVPHPIPQTEVVDRWLETRRHLKRHEDSRDLHLPKFRRENTKAVPWVHPGTGLAKTQPEDSRTPLKQKSTGAEARAESASVESAPRQPTDAATPVSPDSGSAITQLEERPASIESVCEGGSVHSSNSTHAAEPVDEAEPVQAAEPVCEIEPVYAAEFVHDETATEQLPGPGLSNVDDDCLRKHMCDQKCLVDQMVCGVWQDHWPGFLGLQIHGEVLYMEEYFIDLVSEADATAKKTMAKWDEENALKAKKNGV
jgi:hypothetical protein